MDYKKKYEEILEKNALLQKIHLEGLKVETHKLPSLFSLTDSTFQLITPIYDENHKVVDYYYKNINNLFLSKIGKTRDEVINKKGTDVIGFHEDYWFKTLRKVAQTGNSIIYENYSQTRDIYF